MIRRIIRLALFVAIVTAAYIYFQPQADRLLEGVRDRWDLLRKDTVVAQEPEGSVSAQVADQAERKIEQIRDGTGRETFTTSELQSLLQFRYAQVLPEYVQSPRIRLDEDHVEVRVRLPVSRLPGTEDFRRILGLLPDTTDLVVRGTVLPYDDGYVAFAVDALTAQRIPLPARLVPPVLDLLGREDAPGLPDDAVRIPLPDGARNAYVRADSLVVLSTGVR